MSSTVIKAISLLDFFSETEPEIGLSDLARRAGLDKATVHRMLNALAECGLVEQRSDSKLYRLGAGVLRLARVREKAFPITSIIQPILESLSADSGETAHASMLSGRRLATLGISESARSNRVSLIAGEVLPLHSTASGIATLAFAAPALVKAVLAAPKKAKTAHTVTDKDALQHFIAMAEANGYAEADQTNEADVYGIAVPVFDRIGVACGALAVATPAHRMNAELRQQIITLLFTAAERATLGMGGRLPEGFVQRMRSFR